MAIKCLFLYDVYRLHVHVFEKKYTFLFHHENMYLVGRVSCKFSYFAMKNLCCSTH